MNLRESMLMRGERLTAFLVLVACSSQALARQPGSTIRLAVDLRDAPERLLHAHQSIPVAPGPLTLFYPRWIPGEHGPTGPIADLAGLTMTAAGKLLSWERDPIDMHAFRVEVPQGAATLEIDLDYLAPSGAGNFTAGPSTSARAAVLSWNTVLLYPAGRAVEQMLFEPSLHLPPGWQAGTALRIARQSGEEIVFEPVSLVTLIDSPVNAGAHYAHVPLPVEGAPPHQIHLVADSQEALAMSPGTRESYRRLVAEGLALFGAHHYREYHFLLTLSDVIDHFGLEHHESSDNRVAERTLLDDDLALRSAGLLPHEFVHSWNAKYRRPAGLVTADYQAPMNDDLLWVYEGLTSYLGEVLTARSGLWSPEHARQSLALIAAGLAHTPGRRWRPLADTTRAAQMLYGASDEWASWRRGVDFYDEGVLIWLEADTIIRRETRKRASLDDFCRRFFGPPSGGPEVRAYTLDELIAALAAVVPYDWQRFFAERVDRVNPEPPLGGISGGGWKLEYSDRTNEHMRVAEESDDMLDLRFSLGLSIRDEAGSRDHGRVLDVIPELPAATAGIAPGMRLVAVNGRGWSADLLRDALHAGQAHGKPIELLVENAEFYSTHAILYRGGERYPHLVREESRDDLLSEILRPRTAPPQ